MNVFKKYWNAVYIYVLALVPFFCSCAGTYWTICKIIGWYKDVSWGQIITFDVCQLIYISVSLYFISCNQKNPSFVVDNLNIIKHFISLILFIQYNCILNFFASSHVWECTFLFFLILVFLFDSKLLLTNILVYFVLLLLAHIINPAKFIPTGDTEVIAFRLVIYFLTSFCILIIVYFVKHFLMKTWESEEESTKILEKAITIL